MAVMWPKRLPREIEKHILRSTECEVYRRLRGELDDSFVVYYSRPWLGLRPDGEEIDGECDFVVAHAKLGLLALEVKGGAVGYDPSRERWTSKDRWGFTHRVKNPVKQARNAKHVLLRKLKGSRRWAARRIRARHGVILPHSSSTVGDLGADMPRRLFCFFEEFRDGLGQWVGRRFGSPPFHGGRTKQLGRDGLRALEGILAKPFQLRTPLGALLSLDDDELRVLTQQQFHILRAIEQVAKAAISGGAGTGKTVLAIEEARRWAECGARTLFLCFNRGLARDVRHRLKDGPPVVVRTFHQLCKELIDRAEIALPSAVTLARKLREDYPILLLEAFDQLPHERFDAIIVDEGQDFLPDWWAAVAEGLDPGGKQILRIFHDDNQRVYGSALGLPKDVAPIPIRLFWNLRNTKRIHELVSLHYRGQAIQPLGPQGVAVEWIEVRTDRQIPQRVKRYVDRLVASEKIRERDIAVLVSTQNKIMDYAPHNRLGRFSVARCDELAHAKMIVDSIRRFKGLERPVVVVAATPDTVVSREIPYVALSRARAHLAVVGTAKVLERMRKSA